MKKHQIIKRLSGLFLFLMIGIMGNAQSVNPNYNKELADSLGSDDYGMKSFVLVVLKTGSADIKEKAVVDSLFRGHLQNINRLVEMGKLVVAGPLKKNDKSYRGIFILNVPTIEEAKTLVDTDPAVKAQLLDCEYYGWYGSAALPMYLPFSEKIEKVKF